jgi:alpha-L-glutamate ligase-like protein/uncharacterized protein (TIGR02421 family)
MALFSNHGILGINARNLLYIRAYNKRKAVKMADSKLKTKNFLSARGVPVPRLYGTIRDQDELEKFDFSALPNNFVLKPNRGAGGEGILPIWDRKDGNYILSAGGEMTQDEMEEHIRDTLDGRFSISGIADIAFFEQLLICDERIAKFAYKGLPDLRIVVHNLVPVMAMLRLPTRRSNGKANLHQGAIGVGIDIAKGECTSVVQGSQVIEEVPEAGSIRGFKIPYWEDILMIASRIQVETNLGYLAVDISIDQNSGPVLLEINARAGLGLQIANLSPLRQRLERIQGVKVTTPEKGVRVAKDMFGNVVEREIKHMTGKEVVGTIEPVKLLVGSKPYRVMARINASIEKSQMDEVFGEKIGFINSERENNEQRAKFILAGKRVSTVVSMTDLSTKDYDMVIGRRDLAGFLLDPTKKASADASGIDALPVDVEKVDRPESQHVIRRKNYRVVDDAIVELDQQIKLLYHLKPLNLESERMGFLSGDVENPQFTYPELKFDPYKLREKLDDLNMDDSNLGRLFQRKRQEIIEKVDLLEHRGTKYFGDKSAILFGEATENLKRDAEQRLAEKPESIAAEKATISADKAQKQFEKFFRKNGLSSWRVKMKKEMVADCVAGKKNTFFIREDVMFTETRMKMVIAHEIETHIFTAENGKLQPYKIFQRGTGGYLTTQEGLAIYNQEQAVDVVTEKHFWNAALVIAIHVAQTGSFRDVYNKMIELGYPEEKSFQFALKSKRGLEDTSQPGAFTKDLIYFRGRQMVTEFVENGGDLKRLFIGKIDFPSLEEIEGLPFLVAPKFVPKY